MEKVKQTKHSRTQLVTTHASSRLCSRRNFGGTLSRSRGTQVVNHCSKVLHEAVPPSCFGLTSHGQMSTWPNRLLRTMKIN
ncbi:hypothetical protein E2C01_029451 [Portunus trituberculatus]|uniref:Uncharacterized protein n=1 Tax=Portunus trituberculatus TaxID=210409 RepID=A0A5B7ERV7_PORTR|nr:hypothetical protein [Portunus trituberculatus]